MPESSARAILLNRILIALGFVGLFISGYLSVVKILKLMPMCGVQGGCMAVTDHPTAFWFGQPVAFFGLAGFIAIFGLATLREVLGRELSRALVGLGLLLSTFGLFASIYLQYTALFVIQETCKWCIGSAVTMLATFIGHVMLFGQANDAENPVFRPRVKAIPFVIAGLAVTALAIGVTPKTSQHGPPVVDANIRVGVELIPKGAHSLGNVNAPVTIVEFADFCCPTCRQTAMSTRALVKKYPDKVRLVYRHFPLLGLEGHEMNYKLAIASEFAAKSGKFWTFHEAAMSSPEVPKTVEQVLTIAGNVGLDVVELGKIIDRDDTPEFAKIYGDLTDAMKLDAPGTPAFFVLAPGQKPKIVEPTAIEGELEKGEFAKFVH